MTRPPQGSFTSDHIPPVVSMTAPVAGTVSGTITVSCTATDNYAVASVQFKVDGVNYGAPQTVGPFTTTYDTRGLTDGSHTFSATATDTSGNVTTATAVTVTTLNNIVRIAYNSAYNSTTLSGIPAGARIVVAVATGGGDGTLASLSDSVNGAAYTYLTDYVVPAGPGGGDSIHVYIYTVASSAAGSPVITATNSGGGGGGILYNVMITAVAYARAGTLHQNTGGHDQGSHSGWSGPAFAPAVTREVGVLVTNGQYDGGTGGPVTAAPFTELESITDNDDSDTSLDLWDYITSTGSGATPSGTNSNGGDVYAALVSFEGS